MSKTDILRLAASIFGKARMITTLDTTSSLHATPTTTLEIRGAKDGAWRPLGKILFEQTPDLLVAVSTDALNEDIRRAGAIFNA